MNCNSVCFIPVLNEARAGLVCVREASQRECVLLSDPFTHQKRL